MIKEAINIIKQGGVIAIPTDTVYGLSCSIYNESAIRRIYEIKGREFKNPLITHIANIEQLKELTPVNDKILNLAQKFWPGALTLVFSPTFSVRIPGHPVPLEIIKAAGPITSTSANISGQPAATTAEEVKQQLSNKVDLIIDGGKSPIGQASTIIDVSQEPFKILRQGSISKKEIEKAIRPPTTDH